MSRQRMEWDWAYEYPIFVYMRFLYHNKWDVKVVKGKKNDQNAKGYGPSAPAWFNYVSYKNSRSAVCEEAITLALEKIQGER